jgi:hypothetical protein
LRNDAQKRASQLNVSITQIKMNKSISELFKQAIKNGTGEAILLLKENPSADFDQYILEACTHNLAYDPQCEGSRSEYLSEILSLSRDKEKIENEIFKQLDNPSNDHWDTILLFDLAAVLAQNGNENARKVIYDRYEKNLKAEYDFVETEVLVTLDGLKGLEFAANIQGEKIELDSTYWADNYLIEVCKEHYPESSPQKHLEEKSQNNKYIETFLSKIEEIESLRRKGKTINKRSLSQLLQLIEEGKTVPIISGKWLKDEEVLKVANLLLIEEDDKKIQPYLRLLSRTQYPLDISNLLPFLDTDNEGVKHSTLKILEKIEDYIIRELIDRNYTNYSYLNEHIEFFVSNFLEKDIGVLCDILDTLEDEEEIHSFGMVIRDIFDKNVIKHPSKLLNKLYMANNCSICRAAFIKKLISAQQLSDKILREMRYDCEPDIRQLADTYYKKC